MAGDWNLFGMFGDLASLSAGKENIFLVLGFFTILIVIYALFIFYFYRFLAKKDLIKLNLRQYNTTSHPVLSKFFAVVFYVVEYILIIPIVTFFWFAVLSMFLLVLSKTADVGTIILVSAALIAAVRVTSYVTEDISRDLAKMLPLTLLALFIIEPNFFVIQTVLERVQQIPSLLSHIPYYLIFIIGIEFVLRIANSIRLVFKKEVVEVAKV